MKYDVRPIEDNDIVQVINLMKDVHGDQTVESVYPHNQAVWISNLMILYHNSKQADHALLLGCFSGDELLGFITGDVFNSGYDDRLIADMKDCVNAGNGMVFKLLFDSFLEHYKSIGIPDWRFDSIKKDPEDRGRLEKFLVKHYSETNDINLFVSVRGIQTESNHEEL